MHCHILLCLLKVQPKERMAQVGRLPVLRCDTCSNTTKQKHNQQTATHNITHQNTPTQHKTQQHKTQQNNTTQTHTALNSPQHTANQHKTKQHKTNKLGRARVSVPRLTLKLTLILNLNPNLKPEPNLTELASVCQFGVP